MARMGHVSGHLYLRGWPLLDLRCPAPTLSCRSGESGQVAQYPSIQDPARHPNSRGGESFRDSMGIILEGGGGALQPGGRRARVGQWVGVATGLWHDAAQFLSSDPNPSRIFLFCLGWACNQHPLGGIRPLWPSADCSDARGSEVKNFCPGIRGLPCPLRSTWCRAPAGPHNLSHLSKNRPTPTALEGACL